MSEFEQESAATGDQVTWIPTRPSWWDRARCNTVDPSVFFPERGSATAAAKKLCATCTVKHPCLMTALSNTDGFGIWAGTSPRSRTKLRTNGWYEDKDTGIAYLWDRYSGELLIIEDDAKIFDYEEQFDRVLEQQAKNRATHVEPPPHVALRAVLAANLAVA